MPILSFIPNLINAFNYDAFKPFYMLSQVCSSIESARNLNDVKILIFIGSSVRIKIIIMYTFHVSLIFLQLGDGKGGEAVGW